MTSIIIDTNVFISALRSSAGTSFRLLSLIGTGAFDINISVPLILEYEAVAKRHTGLTITLSDTEVDDVIDYICSVAKAYQIYYLWRPQLKDPHDDMLVELAIAAQCQTILTFNLADFRNIEHFGIEAIKPGDFLARIGVKK